MKTNNQRSPKSEPSGQPQPRPIVSRARWTNRGTHPRLVSFSWSPIAERATRR
jgi:hypothetical protein